MRCSAQKYEVVPLEELQRRLIYNPENGHFTWKWDSTKPNSWNSRYAGKIAGCIRPKDNVVVLQIQAGGKLRVFCAHVVAWAFLNGHWPELEVDHKNGDRSDNRKDNLRLATHQQNMFNQNLARSKFGFKGVSADSKTGKPVAAIRVSGKLHHLGTFNTPVEAAKAYDCAAVHYFGDYAKTNGMLGLL